jgi:hypothetical protein
MKPENDPVTDDEFVLRLIWEDYFKPDLDLPIQARAFEPKKNEIDGISVFRQDCLHSPSDTLAVIAEDKRNRYYIARVAVRELLVMGLTVRPDPISTAPGHAVLPELNINAFNSDRLRWKEVLKQLAELASRNIVHRPAA